MSRSTGLLSSPDDPLEKLHSSKLTSIDNNNSPRKFKKQLHTLLSWNFMRSVSFVEYLEFEFSGNILERAIALGDVDNDGGCELVVANISGDLSIFKGSDSRAWRQYVGLGMVSCIMIGDVCNLGRNVVFCLTSEGSCHLMCFGEQCVVPIEDIDNDQNGDVISLHHQSFPTNSKVGLVADVDGDGVKELIIASTDRVVRVFKWVKEEMQEDTQEKPALTKQNSKSSLKRFLSKDSSESKTEETDEQSGQDTSSESEIFSGKFVCVKRWKLEGQVESLSVIEGCSGTSPAILVSQPGGGYIYLFCGEQSIKENLHKQTKKLIPKSSTISFTDCYSSVDNSKPQRPLARRNETLSSVPTHAISWYNRSVRLLSANTHLIAMCTLNGTLSIIKDEKMYMSKNLQHNFFTVQKHDMTGDGREEVIFCSWGGETFIMDQYENIVNFKLGQEISAFCAGSYSRIPGESNPCLVYVTFNNRIRLYWNVKLGGLELKNFNDTVVCRLDEFDMDPRFLDYIEGDHGSLDNDRIKQLTSWCLYGAKAEMHGDKSDSDDEAKISETYQPGTSA